MYRSWIIPGSVKDTQSITSDWQHVSQSLIEGVRVKEVRNVPKEAGQLTEIYRRDWDLDNLPVEQVFQGLLLPGAISGWHAHEYTTDRLFCNDGVLKIVLYDTRPESPTCGQINEFRFGSARPAMVVVPPKVWHAVKNIGQEQALLLNIVDRAYCYENPDHWRLPHDTESIPYSLTGVPRPAPARSVVSRPHLAAEFLVPAR